MTPEEKKAADRAYYERNKERILERAAVKASLRERKPPRADKRVLPCEVREKWNPALGIWMTQKLIWDGKGMKPDLRDGRIVWALPGGREYVES